MQKMIMTQKWWVSITNDNFIFYINVYNDDNNNHIKKGTFIMNFDSSIKSPINDALDILINLNPKHFATLNDPIKLQKYRNQFLVVLQERLINQKTLKQCAEILNKSQERTRQIEAKLIRILRTKMKGYK